MAIMHVALMSVSSYVVVADFSSALQAIQKFNSPLPIIYCIQLWLHCISREHRDIGLHWVPGHINVQGNEQKDSAAYSAVCYLPISHAYAFLELFCSDLSTAIDGNSVGPQQIVFCKTTFRFLAIFPSLSYLGDCTLPYMYWPHQHHRHLMEKCPAPLCKSCCVATLV